MRKIFSVQKVNIQKSTIYSIYEMSSYWAVHQPKQVCLELPRSPWVVLPQFLVQGLYSFFFLLNKWDVKGMQAFPCWISIDNSVKDDRGEIEIAYLKQIFQLSIENLWCLLFLFLQKRLCAMKISKLLNIRWNYLNQNKRNYLEFLWHCAFFNPPLPAFPNTGLNFLSPICLLIPTSFISLIGLFFSH